MLTDIRETVLTKPPVTKPSTMAMKPVYAPQATPMAESNAEPLSVLVAISPEDSL